MKRTIPLVLVAGVLFAGSRSNAQSFEYTLYYDFSVHQAGAAVQTHLRSFENVLGRNMALDLNAMVGAYFDSGTPFAGFSLTKGFDLAKGARGFVGPAFTVQNGQPASVGLVAGVRF